MKKKNSHIKPQRLVVLGAGESGIGTAILGKQKGYEVFVSDNQEIKEEYKNQLLKHNITWEEKQHTSNLILNANLVVKSPGIPDKVNIVEDIKNKGISVISEIEFASKYTNATLIAISGSNGKTTTAILTHHLLKTQLEVGLAGNIGQSFALQVATTNPAYYVLELSSFQLDGIKDFKPHIAILTNISPDHLDRYDDNFQAYVDSKFKLIKNQTEADYFIYDADDGVISKWLEDHKIKPKQLPFSLTKTLENGAYLKNKDLIITPNNNPITMPISALTLQGKHNQKNAMAASTVARLLDIRKETIRKSLESFQGVEHRLEQVLKIQNVLYINDSKATNVNAAFYALDSVKTPVVWIVGGVDKGNDYTQLLALVNEKVKAIICLGLDNDSIIKTFGNIVELMVETSSMKGAVELAYRIAERGDSVLLSPACASFDLFEDYEDRGRQFKEAVRKL
ncbi:MAG: UDP-N-acetylmuramoyl-L-alanine--D-glutamate ligase [Flavobacteriaceae bacterium]|nr:UDP-N-acetylmuramoyl-L-alanine--D-glutamate ligase [Flavobacteriaceae bacterium]